MDVVFKIRRSDLRRVLRELQANRGPGGRTDLVTVLVSEYAATFRAPGTDSEYPVHGVSPGVARMPIAVLDRISDMRTGNELELRITDGAVLCGKATVRHEAIKLSTIPNIRVQVPIDPSPFELVVIGRVLGENLVAEQGLEERLCRATEQMNHAISRATLYLSPFGVTEASVRSLVEAAVENARADIQRGLFGHLPRADSALATSDVRSSLLTRARKDAASLTARSQRSEYLATARSGGKWGFIGKDGSFVIDPIHFSVDSFSCGRALFSASPISYEEDRFMMGSFGYLDLHGNAVIPPQFERARPFSDGYAAVQERGKWGFIDEGGGLVVQPRFEAVHDFTEGLAAAKLGGKFGYIDRNGNFVIQPRFDMAYGFSEGLASICVQDDEAKNKFSEVYFIDRYGTVAFVQENASDVFGDFVEGVALVHGQCSDGPCICGAESAGMDCESDYAYYADKSGKTLTNKYGMRALGEFSNGFGIVSLPVDSYNQPGRYLFGCVDRKGRIEIQNELPFAICIENGRELTGAEFQLIAQVDESIRIPEFDSVYNFHEGIARVRVDKRYGFIDVHGKVIIEPTFPQARDFKNGMALVSDKEWLDKGAKWGFIDTSGRVVIPCQFESAGDFERTAP